MLLKQFALEEQAEAQAQLRQIRHDEPEERAKRLHHEPHHTQTFQRIKEIPLQRPTEFGRCFN